MRYRINYLIGGTSTVKDTNNLSTAKWQCRLWRMDYWWGGIC